MVGIIILQNKLSKPIRYIASPNFLLYSIVIDRPFHSTIISLRSRFMVFPVPGVVCFHVVEYEYRIYNSAVCVDSRSAAAVVSSC